MLWIVKKHGFSDTLFSPLAEEDGAIPIGDFYRPREYKVNSAPKPLVSKDGNTLITQRFLATRPLIPVQSGSPRQDP